jgi:flagellar motor switch protein FliN/FliY
MAAVLSQIAGAPLAVECSAQAPAEAPPPGENDVRMIVTAAGGLRGEMSLRIPPAVALGMAQLFLSEPQDLAAEFKSDHREAIEELLRQVAGQAATGLKPRWGEVQLHVESAGAPSWSAAASGWLASAGDTPCRVSLEWQLSAALNASLVAAQAATSSPSEPSPERAPVQAPPGVPDASSNLGLLLDVELDVTLRFGQRSLLLREILELDAGSVVELDRRVEEPVDLLLDDRLIARGEVVVVDGNYGLRVLEVLTPQAPV